MSMRFKIGFLSLAILLWVGVVPAWAQVYQIGDLYTAPDGSQGIVYYLHPDGSGGWVVALNDASSGCAWGTVGDIPGLDNRNPGSNNRQQLLNDTAGYAHTQAIRAYQNNDATTAAGVVDFVHGWYLPSPAQLSILYGQLPLIESALTAAGGATLNTDNYWSSAEQNSDNAWYVIFSYGYFNSGGKTSSNRVRAVRSFTYPSADGVTYVWNTGATGSDITVSSAGTYSVTATNPQGCYDADTMAVDMDYSHVQCPTHLNLDAAAHWNNVALHWQATYPQDIINDTLSYHVNRIGGGSFGDNITFTMATRYPKDSLARMSGKYLTHVGAYTGTIPETARLHIYVLGNENPTVLDVVSEYTQDIPVNSIQLFSYNLFPLDVPIPVDTSKSLIIGYEYINVSGGCVQVGSNNVQNLYNNLMCDADGWFTLNNIGASGYAWIIDGYFGDGDFAAYDVYRDNVKLNSEPINGNSFVDMDISEGASHCYSITALCATSMSADLVCVTAPPMPQVQPCAGTPTVTDYDGNVYNTVQIGNQCWMRENMRATHYADGTALHTADTANADVELYYPTPGDAAVYGLLYNLAGALRGYQSNLNPSRIQGVCPTGWHVPSNAEMAQLKSYIVSNGNYTCGGNSDYIAKSLASTAGWPNNDTLPTCAVANNPSANNLTGFSFVPHGYFFGEIGGGFGTTGYTWTSSPVGTSFPAGSYYDIDINSTSFNPGHTWATAGGGLAVRCLKGNTIATVFSDNVFNIQTTTAMCRGSVTQDGGETVTARGFCWNTTGTPTLSDAHTLDSSGVGTFTTTLTGLTAGTTYYVRAYATNALGTTYGIPLTFTTSTFNCGTSIVTDYDDNLYYTVQLGDQCWMRENLRTTHYADGIAIPAGSAGSYEVAYRYNPNNDANNVATYGYLYNYMALMHGAASSAANPSGVQGICPTGWHVPSDAEWTQLTDYVSSVPEYRCGGDSTRIAKAMAATEGWENYGGTCVVGNDQSANNATGFTARPAGSFAVSYDSYTILAYLWSCTENSENNRFVMTRYINRAGRNVKSGGYSKINSYPVRCLKGTALATVFTNNVSNVENATAVCSGNVTCDGGEAVTARGFCWNTTGSPTLNDAHTTNGSGVGTFTTTLTGLQPGTTYYVRAYATNAWGTAYGAEVTFTIVAVSAAVGDILCTDGSWVSPGDYAASGKTALGVIFQVDDSGMHGWAVNLHDDCTSCIWGGYGDIPTLPNSGISDTAGYSNTQIIRNAGNASAYPAAWAVDFGNGWYLPAIGQLNTLYGVRGTVNPSLTTAGGTVLGSGAGSWFYWSSTESDSYSAWYLSYSGSLTGTSKYITNYRVRGVRAF